MVYFQCNVVISNNGSQVFKLITFLYISLFILTYEGVLISP